jgi:hypothetical protein
MALLHDAPLLPHARVIKANEDHPSLVRPRWLNAVAVTVKWFTVVAQIQHFVMAITSLPRAVPRRR